MSLAVGASHQFKWADARINSEIHHLHVYGKIDGNALVAFIINSPHLRLLTYVRDDGRSITQRRMANPHAVASAASPVPSRPDVLAPQQDDAGATQLARWAATLLDAGLVNWRGALTAAAAHSLSRTLVEAER